MKYVYINSEPGLYTVGFYDPNGKWIAESDHTSSESAAQRVHWLNGGRTTLDAEKPASGVVYQTAEERAAKKSRQSLDLNDILVALNILSFHLVQFSAKVASYSPQQDLKDAASVLEDAAYDLQDALGKSGVLGPEQEAVQS